MNARQLSLVLLLLNLGLLTAVIYLVATARLGKVDSSVAVNDRSITNTVTQIAVRKINATNFLAALANRQVNWRMLESTNYFAYANNLRNFGCPEDTVRDIIITDVVKSYAERRRELRAHAPPPEFWKTSADGTPGVSADLGTALAELDREQAQLIQDVLGVSLESELARYGDDAEVAEPVVTFLPEGKRGQVLSMQARYASLAEEIHGKANGMLLDSDHEALRKLRTQRETELAQMLTPEELLTYHLYNSETAGNLRAQMDGFSPTQDEFVKVFQLQKAYDDQFGDGFDLTDDAALGIRGRAEQDASLALDEELRKSLGPVRYAEYQRGQDGDYRALKQLTERYQLGPEAANNVYTMKSAAEGQKLRIESNPNLNDLQRAQMLASLAQETEKTVATVLGGGVFKDYQRGPGQWLNNLYFFDEENLPPEPEIAAPSAQPSGPLLPPVPHGAVNSLPPGYRELLLPQLPPNLRPIRRNP